MLDMSEDLFIVYASLTSESFFIHMIVSFI